MARKPSEMVQVNLRIKEGRRRELQRLAEKNRISFNKQIEILIDSALENKAKQSFEGIAADMDNLWLRLSERLLLLDLEQNLAEALANTTDREISALAQAWLAHRRLHQQRLDKGRKQ